MVSRRLSALAEVLALVAVTFALASLPLALTAVAMPPLSRLTRVSVRRGSVQSVENLVRIAVDLTFLGRPKLIIAGVLALSRVSMQRFHALVSANVAGSDPRSRIAAIISL